MLRGAGDCAAYAFCCGRPGRCGPSLAGSKRQPARNELATRLAAAETARNSGDAVAIARANYLVIGAALRELADLRVAESDDLKAVELYRGSLQYEDAPGTYAAMGYAEIQAGEFDKAIEFARQALARDPANLRAARIMAGAYNQKGEYAQAVECLPRVAQAEPSVDNLYLLLECLLATGKPEDKARALETFEQMKRVAGGDDGSLHVLLGRAYRDAGDMHAAIREFKRAIAIDPRTPHAHYFLGLAQLVLNELEAHAGMPRRRCRRKPSTTRTTTSPTYCWASSRRGNGSMTNRTSTCWPLQESPYRARPISLSGSERLFAEEKMDVAEKMLRKAVELTGKDEARANYQIRRAYVDLAASCFRSGRTRGERGLCGQSARTAEQGDGGNPAECLRDAWPRRAARTPRRWCR